HVVVGAVAGGVVRSLAAIVAGVGVGIGAQAGGHGVRVAGRQRDAGGIHGGGGVADAVVVVVRVGEVALPVAVAVGPVRRRVVGSLAAVVAAVRVGVRAQVWHQRIRVAPGQRRARGIHGERGVARPVVVVVRIARVAQAVRVAVGPVVVRREARRHRAV